MNRLLTLSSALTVLLFVGCAQSPKGSPSCDEGQCDHTETSPVQDAELREILANQGVEALERENSYSGAMLELGQALFFEKEISGNRDISCATCHHPLTMTGDMISLPIGVGGSGLGPDREIGADRGLIPRNAPDVYNRGSSLWNTMFWDNRVSVHGTDRSSPAGSALAENLETPLQIQAMFPPTSAAEMRGNPGDLDRNGNANELAAIPEDDLPAIWGAIAKRLVAIDKYVELFQEAYPGISVDEIGFEHAAQAIAAFEDDAFTFTNSPFDQYLRGDNSAMSADAKEGARLFYGKAKCGQCHTGTLLSDQSLHNICSPQAGPGRGEDAPEDIGGFAVTGKDADRYAFRTPSLRNVVLTGPWMHAGTYTDLELAVRHHLDVQGSMMNYDASQLSASLQDTALTDFSFLQKMLRTLDPVLQTPISLSDREVDQVMDFLISVTDFDAGDLNHTIPTRVPSGLPVHD